MLNPYIKNKGITKTIISDNNHNYVNQINWDADYDGDMANISIDTNTNGKSKHLKIKLDNEDLANLLNVQSVNMPIDKRLQNDFNVIQYAPQARFIELPINNDGTTSSIIEESETPVHNLIDRRISSPNVGDMFLPIPLNTKATNKNTKTHKKRHKHNKTHHTYKLTKKSRSRSSRTSSTKNKNSNTPRKKTR